jgi:hypothetical protein
MTAFNVVRFRVKPGREEDFLDAHRQRKGMAGNTQSAEYKKMRFCRAALIRPTNARSI